MKWEDFFLSNRAKLIRDLKGGGYFKISYPDGKPFIIGYCNNIVENKYGDDWHGLNCVFFYNFTSETLKEQRYCGLERENTLSKPTIKDYKFIEELLGKHNYRFNRKKRKLYGTFKKWNNI